MLDRKSGSVQAQSIPSQAGTKQLACSCERRQPQSPLGCGSLSLPSFGRPKGGERV
jgi:hypothetical protein